MSPSWSFLMRTYLLFRDSFTLNQQRNQKEYQKMVRIPFINLEKINIFGFMHKGVAQKLSLPCPLEN